MTEESVTMNITGSHRHFYNNGITLQKADCTILDIFKHSTP